MVELMYYHRRFCYAKRIPTHRTIRKRDFGIENTRYPVRGYEYDSMGRISKEKDSSGNVLRSYTYDSYGQLTRENNAVLDKTFVYEYNNGGITKVKEYAYTTSSTPTGTATEKAYTYDSTYPDRLTKCGSTSISYNSMGCPTTCNGYTASWTRGKLSKLTKALFWAGKVKNLDLSLTHLDGLVLTFRLILDKS